MKRIEKLRRLAFKEQNFSDEFYYLFYKKYDRCEALSEQERYAESFYYAFSNLTPSVSDGELIVGKRDILLGEKEQKEWESDLAHTAVEHRLDRRKIIVYSIAV